MLVRAVVVAALLLAASPAAAGARRAVVRSEVADYADIIGVGCGTAATHTVSLPGSASAIRVKRPHVGDTTEESQLTAVTIAGASVQLTAVGAGASLCDPEADPDVPPAERSWHATYLYDIAFHQRVRVAYWPGAQVPRARPRLRPRRVRVPDQYNVIRMRWRTFGGRRAVGHGRLRCAGIPGCVGHGDRFKVVLDRPRRCRDVGNRVFYGRVRLYTTRRYPNPYYPIRRGALYNGTIPDCASGPTTRA